MMNRHSQSVNVSRLAMLEALRSARTMHAAEYKEARTDYEAAVVKFLESALDRARNGDFKEVKINFHPPVDHTAEYDDVIEMMEVSVDETINLDRETYKAYYKNEWSWTAGFKMESTVYKTMIGGAM
jgi:hypothetical protein